MQVGMDTFSTGNDTYQDIKVKKNYTHFKYKSFSAEKHIIKTIFARKTSRMNIHRIVFIDLVREI